MNNWTTGALNYYFYGLLIPVNFSGTVIDNYVRLTWTEFYSPDIQIEVYHSIDNVNYKLLALSSLGASAIDVNSYQGVNVYFKIRAVNNNYTSEFSTPIIINTPAYFNLLAKGDGSGVNTLTVNVSENVNISLTGTARFYTDLLGTVNESTSFLATPGIDRTIYFKCTGGSAFMLFQKAEFINKISIPHTLVTNTPLITGDVSGFINIETLSLEIDINCAVSGDITNLKRLKSLLLQGSTTVYGSLSDKLLMTYIAVSGLNSLYGDISKHTLLTSVNVGGLNNIFGDIGINNMVNGIQPTLYIAPNKLKKYTSGAVWSNANITLNSFIGFGYNSNEIDSIIIDMANSPTLISKTVNLLGGNSHRTVVSDAAYAVLTGVGRTNIVNTNIQRLPFDNGKIVFTFDGGLASCFTKAYPLFLQHGCSGTFYITINQVGVAGYVTWSQLQTMFTNGMDLECHTNTHTGMTTLTEAQVYAQYDAVDAAFIAHGLPAPRHTAYPWGSNNANVQTWTATRRDTARGVLYNRVGTNDNKYDLPSIDLTTELQANLLNIVPALEYVKENNQALIFLIHSIDNGTDMKLQQLADIISYARSMNIDILTIPELYALM